MERTCSSEILVIFKRTILRYSLEDKTRVCSNDKYQCFRDGLAAGCGQACENNFLQGRVGVDVIN
jgi:hypothetical protein